MILCCELRLPFAAAYVRCPADLRNIRRCKDFSGTVIKHKIRPECQHSVNHGFFATLRPLLLYFGISDCDDF